MGPQPHIPGGWGIMSDFKQVVGLCLTGASKKTFRILDAKLGAKLGQVLRQVQY